MAINWLDIVLVLPLLVGLVIGLIRGFISEIIAIAVVIFGVLGARLLGPMTSAWTLKQFAWPPGVCDLVSYLVVFFGIAIVLSIAAYLLNELVDATNLTWVNRIAGGVFGLCKYGLIVLLVVFVMNKSDEAFHWTEKSPVVKSSMVYPVMVKGTDLLLGTVNEMNQP